MSAVLSHLEAALEHHRAGREGYAEVRASLARIAELVERALAAHRLGNDAATRARLEDLEAETSDAISSRGIAGVQFSKARRAVQAARDSLCPAVPEQEVPALVTQPMAANKELQ